MFESAIKLADVRERLCKNPPKCPVCEDAQVQLVDWILIPDTAFWKCRICKHPFVTQYKE